MPGMNLNAIPSEYDREFMAWWAKTIDTIKKEVEEDYARKRESGS